MRYTRCHPTLVKLKSFENGRVTYITVEDDSVIYFYRNNMTAKIKAWQCFNDEYYFKSEEDLNRFLIYSKREENLNELGI